MVGGSFRDLVFFLFFLKVFRFQFLLDLHGSVGRGGWEGGWTLARCRIFPARKNSASTKFKGIGGGDAQLDSPLGRLRVFAFFQLLSSHRRVVQVGCLFRKKAK